MSMQKEKNSTNKIMKISNKFIAIYIIIGILGILSTGKAFYGFAILFFFLNGFIIGRSYEFYEK